MDFYEAVYSRRTTRDFCAEDVDEKTIERIICAGMKAPTNDHMRSWHFIVISDKKTIAALLEKIPKKVSDEEIRRLFTDWNLNDACQRECYRNAVPKQYRMLFEASKIIIPLFKQDYNLLTPQSISELNGFASIWCCIENILLASAAEGLSCSLRIPLGNESEWSRSVLGYPDDYIMPCYLGIGKPLESAAKIEQKSFCAAERIHENKW